MNIESTNYKKNRNIATVLLIGFALFLLYELRGFINTFLGAIVIYVLFKPIMIYLSDRWKWKKALAALAIILLSFVIILVPLFFTGKLFFNRISAYLNPETFNQSLIFINVKSKNLLGIELLNADNIKVVQTELTSTLTGIVSQSLGVLGDLGIMYFILFYLLINVGNMERLLEKFIPISNKNLEILGKELETQTYSNALGAPLLATLQGIIACIGFAIFGVNDYLFWGIMAGIFSIIPVIGSALIWLPAALILISKNMQWQGLGLIIYGIVVISTIDNVFRFIFQKKIADVHPLITIIGVIMGLQLFGIAGSIYGPLLLSYFLILLKMYRDAYVVTNEIKEQ